MVRGWTEADLVLKATGKVIGVLGGAINVPGGARVAARSPAPLTVGVLMRCGPTWIGECQYEYLIHIARELEL